MTCGAESNMSIGTFIALLFEEGGGKEGRRGREEEGGVGIEGLREGEVGRNGGRAEFLI